MALATGTRVGSYEILAPIGAGGMGEVYRARDSKLKRDVALKILPDSFAGDPDRMARFQREAEVLASLNHPNIAAIYGVEERALVMELVEGEELKGPLPLDKVSQLCKSDRIGPGGRARQRHRASRSEAGQYQSHAVRCGQGAGLRLGSRRAGFRIERQSGELPDAHAARDPSRPDHGHGGLHVA